MKKVAVYYRVSTERQDLASQKATVEKWIEDLSQDKKPSVIKVFKDEGVSGKTVNRPGFQAMLAAAYKHEIDTIIVYKLDRFSRHATTAIRYLLNLDEAGVAFISVTQPVLNLGHENPFRRTMLAAFAEIAEIERETIVARVKAGLDAAKKRGVTLGAPKKVDAAIEEQVLQLREQGLSYRKISAEVGLSVGSVHALVNSEMGPEVTF